MKPLENWTKLVTCKRIKTNGTSSMTSHMNDCKRVFHTNNPCMNFFHISGFKERARDVEYELFIIRCARSDHS